MPETGIRRGGLQGTDAAGTRRIRRDGIGLAKNEKKAVECFKAAADRDFPAGLLWLAHCHANGIGVKKDLEEARKWARKAADLGVPAGRQMLISIQE